MPATPITIQDTINNLTAMSIPGVKSIRKAAPASVSSAMLPLGYVRNCAIAMDQRSLTFAGGMRVVSCELVILVEASRQGTVDDLYELTRQVADNVAAAIDANAAVLRLDDYSVREDFEGVEASSYFVVLATIRCA